MNPDEASMHTALNGVHQADRARVLAVLIRILGDFDLAEESLQDALVAAVESWPMAGVPSNPCGWLVTTARRKAIDRLRRTTTRDRRQRVWGELSLAWTPRNPDETIGDERLRLIFTCCHPALSQAASVSLTLRTLGGLSTEEVARAFLVNETTIAQRIVRAKRKIRESRIPYCVPPASQLDERLEAVLVVICLIFNAGYLASQGDALIRVDLCDEAKRLALLLTDQLPTHSEPFALAALLHLQDARRSARTDTFGRVLTLEEQDRELWDRTQILQGLQLLERAAVLSDAGPYQLKAGIAAVHATTRYASDTNWAAIIDFYDQLVIQEPSPVVLLNRAVAVAMHESPQRGLALIDDPSISAPLSDYHLFHATRADLLRRCDRFEEAGRAYATARQLTDNTAEHGFLDRRLKELAAQYSD